MHHYLVVANRTLGGPELLDVIRDRLTRGPAAFWVLAPATPSTHLTNDFTALSGTFPVDPDIASSAADPTAGEHGSTRARARLDTELQRLRALGATADGDIGDPDPLTAIETALATRSFDEIILSTLPPGMSRWLALDLPHRLRRRTEVPLTVIMSRDEGEVSDPRPPSPPAAP